MRILVTGAAGYIGIHFVKELREHGFNDVIGVDFKDGDLSVAGNFDMLANRYKPNVVVHLAAQVGRVLGEDNIVTTIRNNAIATALVAQSCGNRSIKLVYASTSEIYGDQGIKDGYEGGPVVLPYNIYGLSKYWGEEVCRLYAPHDLMVWRIVMTYGPGMLAGRGKAALVNFLYQALHRQPIPVHKGSERSWCYIADIVRAMRMLVEQNQTGIWNIGRNDPRPMTEIAEIACELTGAPKTLIQVVPPPYKTGHRVVLTKRIDCIKLLSTGWKPEVEIEEGMRRTLAWVKTLNWLD